MKSPYKIYILNVQDANKLFIKHNLNYDTIVQQAIEVIECTNVLFGMDKLLNLKRNNVQDKFRFYLSEEKYSIIF